MEAVKSHYGGTEDGDEDEDEDMESESEDEDEDEEMEEEEEGDRSDGLAMHDITEPNQPEPSVLRNTARFGGNPIAGPSTISGNRGSSPTLAVKTSDVNYREQSAVNSDDEGGPELSPISHSRPLSRSPPASRHSSQSPVRSRSPSLAEATAALSLVQNERDVRDRVAAEVSKRNAHQQKKYHSKRGAQRMGGRQKGSKAKMDTRYKPERGGLWD